jgi:hypothetical protein
MLQRSILGEASVFNNIETRAVIKFFSMQDKAPNEIHAILAETLGEHSTIKNWVVQFKRGDFSTREIIDQTHELILEVCRPDFG